MTLPVFSCKLDAVVVTRRRRRLWAWETTSGTPEAFSQDLLLDTQLPGYTRALWYVTQQLGAWGGLRPGGYVWDVTSSKLQDDPRQLRRQHQHRQRAACAQLEVAAAPGGPGAGQQPRSSPAGPAAS